MTAPRPSSGADGDEQAPRPSLIQQRMQLNRHRMRGVWMLTIGLVLAASQVLTSALTERPLLIWAWIALLGWLVFAVGGLVTLVRARRSRKLFEAEHGEAAGRQDAER